MEPPFPAVFLFYASPWIRNGGSAEVHSQKIEIQVLPEAESDTHAQKWQCPLHRDEESRDVFQKAVRHVLPKGSEYPFVSAASVNGSGASVCSCHGLCTFATIWRKSLSTTPIEVSYHTHCQTFSSPPGTQAHKDHTNPSCRVLGIPTPPPQSPAPMITFTSSNSVM